MKLQNEGTFAATITGCEWIETQTGKPVCELSFDTDSGSIRGGFYFDSETPKFGTETGLEKNSRAFAQAIPGWTADNMDMPQTYQGQKVTIKTKFNLKGYLNVSAIYPLGGGANKPLTGLQKIQAAAKAATANLEPLPPADDLAF